MAKLINITDGVGTSDLINGSYTVSAFVNGYDNSSINPSTVTVSEGVNTYNFTISASGSLTIHVTEDGTAAGTPIVGATFVRTDALGNIYGNEISSDNSGNAVFNNVPFDQTSAPIIYFKQTASDGNHEFNNSVQNTTLTTQTSTLEIANSLGAVRTINLTDANYNNLPISTAQLSFDNN